MRLANILPDAEQRAAVMSAIDKLVQREVDAIFAADLQKPELVLLARYRAEGARAVATGIRQAFSEAVETRKKEKMKR